ncbi:MAG: hypothetical protein LBE22_05730 [Azoarcus sp.]|nr:hypothetical protein [Azoarcus sp.]
MDGLQYTTQPSPALKPAFSQRGQNVDIRDALRALLARDRAVENWLHNQIGPVFDALKSDPGRAVTAEQVRERLAAEHTKAR